MAQLAPQVRCHQHVAKPKAPEGSEKWICFYPAYINKNKTISEGRRIQKSKAVVAPTCKEIMDVLSTTELKIYVENKIYCREKGKEPANWGRVKIQLYNEGQVIDDRFSKRDDIYLHTAEQIPLLKSRLNAKAPQATQQAQGKQGKNKRKK